MDLTGFFPIGNSVSISATTASTANQLNATSSSPIAGMNLRVVNESTSTALLSISSSTAPDATSDGQRMAVIAGTERIFAWPPKGNTVAVALRAGSGTVQLQLGSGF
jgi:hypothetical protein